MKRFVIVVLEDHGQDFLEWDIKNGLVVACRPLQGWIWVNTQVLNEEIRPGDILKLKLKGGELSDLNYPVEKVLECPHVIIGLKYWVPKAKSVPGDAIPFCYTCNRCGLTLHEIWKEKGTPYGEMVKAGELPDEPPIRLRKLNPEELEKMGR